ncbi:nucleoside triphosphate pyrophosphohydrolase family protein [Chryseobacterium fistulae]|nr:MazG-like protein [Chryseobacterium fistulae]
MKIIFRYINKPHDRQLSQSVYIFTYIFKSTMNQNNLDILIERSLEIRKKYHQLEIQHHNDEWTLEEDALAYLTDAGLVGRNIMSHQKRWMKKDSAAELEHKLAENIWWFIVLADRTGIDIKDSLEKFLTKTEDILK